MPPYAYIHFINPIYNMIYELFFVINEKKYLCIYFKDILDCLLSTMYKYLGLLLKEKL